MHVHNTGANQNGELVISFVSPPLSSGVRRTDRCQFESQTKRNERRTFGVASGAHALHDGYTI